MNNLEFENEQCTIEKTKITFPPLYDVIFFNDDVTAFEFVEKVLLDIYHKTADQAGELTMAVHNHGSAVVGTYSYDIASTKCNKTITLARENNFPLKVEIQETRG